jgi:hypothetical protein
MNVKGATVKHEAKPGVKAGTDSDQGYHQKCDCGATKKKAPPERHPSGAVHANEKAPPNGHGERWEKRLDRSRRGNSSMLIWLRQAPGRQLSSEAAVAA